jgi:hypothetical protein
LGDGISQHFIERGRHEGLVESLHESVPHNTQDFRTELEIVEAYTAAERIVAKGIPGP